MSPCTIRAATINDVEIVLPMVAAICDHHRRLDPERYDFLPDVVERYRRWLPERAVDPRSVFLIAQVDRDAAGFLVGTVERNIPIYQTREFGFIHDVWVEPACRRAGVARALTRAAWHRFRDIGVIQIRLETAAENDAARRLFATCGFRVGSMEMVRQIDAADPPDQPA